VSRVLRPESARHRRLLLVAAVLIGPLGLSSSTAAIGLAPDPPRDLKAEVLGPTAVKLTWREGKDGSNPEFYVIYRNGLQAKIVEQDNHPEWTDDGLSAWTEYTYWVVAVDNRFRTSDPSDSVTVRTADGSPPGVPGSLTVADLQATRVALEWEPASDPESGVVRYVVLRDGKKKGDAEETRFTDDTALPESDYIYAVQAVNGAGDTGQPGDPLSVRTPPLPDTMPPAPPMALRVVQP
jgi:hypothetical protein